jgi:hypothetical protein
MLLLTMGVKKRQIATRVGDVYRVTAATTRTSRARNRRAELSTGLWDTGVSLLNAGFRKMRRVPRAHGSAI